MGMMNSGVVLNLWMAVMLAALLLWKSAMRSDAMANKTVKMQTLPNLVGYEAHFPAVIPDLNVFLEKQRQKQCGNRLGARSSDCKERNIVQIKRTKSSKVASDGLYVLDFLNEWATPINVWSQTTSEINVLLRRGEGWTRELKTYKTTIMVFTTSLQYTIDGRRNQRTLFIRQDPFGGISNSGPRNPMFTEVLRALSCRFLRLSKWVFNPKFGVLAMIYVQVHNRNNNKLRRLFLIHLPKEKFKTQGQYARKASFNYWVYENPTDPKPVPLDQVNPRKLAAAMTSLANNSQNIKKGASSKKRRMSHAPSIEQDRPHSPPSGQYNDSCNQPSVENSVEYQLPYSDVDQVDPTKLAATMNSLANNSQKVKKQASTKKRRMSHTPSIDQDRPHSPPSGQYNDSCNQPSVENSVEHQLPYSDEDESAKVQDVAKILLSMAQH